MSGCVALNCRNRIEDGFRMFAIPTNIQRRKKWLKSLRRERWIPSKSACVCEVHFDESQYEKRRADGWIKLKPNAVPTIFDVHNSSLRIDGIHPPPKKLLKEIAKGNEVAATCVQEVPIISEMNIDYAAPSNHDVFNKVDVSSVSKSLSSDSGQTARENKIIEENNDNKKNPSMSHSGANLKCPFPNVEDSNLREYYTEERIDSLLAENFYLKNKLNRMHSTLKMFLSLSENC